MLEIMKCSLCGKLVMIIRDGGRRTICCDELMEKLVEKGEEAMKETHVPVIERTDTGIRVRFGGFSTPMDRDHYPEWIDMFEGRDLHMKWLKPGDAPEAEFTGMDARVKARVYCEEDGLWSNRPSKPRI